jgi:hypothetical protein
LGISHVAPKFKTHRLVPSRFPPAAVFDWAQTKEELTEIAELENLTNDRLQGNYIDLSLLPKEEWIVGNGATPLMSAFTHPGPSRFSDGTYGVYYAGDSLETAIAETTFHRERFLKASGEAPCLIQMREYIANVKEKLVDINPEEYSAILDPDVNSYSKSQAFAQELKLKQEYGLLYPSVRRQNSRCVAIFRPKALTIPVQGCHLDYVWDGNTIASIRKSVPIK